MDRFELEQTYMAAKTSYYEGNPQMTDDEFDSLESQLLSMGSTVPHIVGAGDRKAKYSHPTPMLSLAKLQASLSGTPPTASAVSWMKRINASIFEITPKYDGNACNIIYKDGKLIQALSRGNGSKGRDITSKILHNISEDILHQGTVEIRGEVVISISTFNEKYSQFKNPRNYVAGILNRDENTDESIADLDFIPVEMKITDNNGNTKYHSPILPGFKHVPHVFQITLDEFEKAYDQMYYYRNNESKYQLDGFVIKAPESIRPELGENSHDPNWAIAIKFPPKEAITKIKSISWQYGKTGELTPVAVMEPVDLDGTMVSRATLFNLGFLKSKRAYPGATVSIAKSGDIIPQIQKVIIEGNESEICHPETCKCGKPLTVDGIHLICKNENCEVIEWFKFLTGINVLGIDGLGHAFAKELWNAGFTNPLELLNPNVFNRKSLEGLEFLKTGKILDNIITEIEKIKEIRPMDIILTMGIDGMGYSTAKQLGNYLSNLPYDFAGLQKSVIEGFQEGGDKRAIYEKRFSEVTQWVKVKLPEQISADSIGFEMTGSPKSAGYKTKEEFLAYAKTKGYHHAGIKDAKILFADDANSNSSKIKTAITKGIKIMTYSEI